MIKVDTRIPVIIKPEYTVLFERCLGLTFIHCDVDRWTKTVCRNLSNDFEALKALHQEPIYAVHEIHDRKHEKFLSLFGFSFSKRVVCVDSEQRDIYVRY